MAITRRDTYAKNEVTSWSVPNYWDVLALLMVVVVIFLFAIGAHAMLSAYQLGQKIEISLSPLSLPYYALRSVIRMLVAMILSLLFTFSIGTLAAKSRKAERVIIPLIDILQSVPVLGYLSLTLAAFVALFEGSLMGLESAAIFAIFTAQVWNMTLSFYQSLRNFPSGLREASDIFHLNSWQRFWRMEVPFAMPGLVWNMMMSMSGSWVFLVASEAIEVSGRNIKLPGLGSYLGEAILHKDSMALCWLILTMFVVILIYDQLLFRPLLAWSDKFRSNVGVEEDGPESWVLDLFQRTRWFKVLGAFFQLIGDVIIRFRLGVNVARSGRGDMASSDLKRRVLTIGRYVISVVVSLALLYWLYCYLDFFSGSNSGFSKVKNLFHIISGYPILHLFYLGLLTFLRVFAAIIVSSIIWVPIGVWVGSRPKVTAVVQPLAQFLAAFPINLLFPIAAVCIATYGLDVNIWCAPLMVLGTQWYILFNVIAGAAALPKNLKNAVGLMHLKGFLYWRKFILPAIFPFYITGAITAAGGAWNISIFAEVIQWGRHAITADGIGAYITQATARGDFTGLALGVVIMILFVLIANAFIWRPLYDLAQRRYGTQ